MADTPIQSSIVPFLLSIDAGVTYKSAVCKISGQIKKSRSVDRQETDCGSQVGLGSLVVTGSYNGMVSTTPAVTELSYEDINGIMVAGTLVYLKVMHPQSGTPGSDTYDQGSGYITDLTLDFDNGKVVLFSFSFESTGTWDVTP